MFRSLRPEPAWQLTDRTVELGSELGAPAAEIAAALLSLSSELERAKLLERYLGSSPLDYLSKARRSASTGEQR